MNPRKHGKLNDASKCKKQAVVTRNAATRTSLLLLMLLCSSSGAVGETYTFHDGASVTSGISRRHRDLDPDRRHYKEVHSSGAAVAKVKAQQRYPHVPLAAVPGILLKHPRCLAVVFYSH